MAQGAGETRTCLLLDVEPDSPVLSNVVDPTTRADGVSSPTRSKMNTLASVFTIAIPPGLSRLRE